MVGMQFTLFKKLAWDWEDQEEILRSLIFFKSMTVVSGVKKE